MIAFIRGQLLEKYPDRVIVDVNGIGYEVRVPLSTFYGMTDPDEEVSFHVHTHVREDALTLFGFATNLELKIFERLIAVNGVGPKLALAVLSGIEPVELVQAVRDGDVARLTAIPGIGKRTAERIGLELKDRLLAVEEVEFSNNELKSSASAELRGNVLSALLNLGYHRPLVERAVNVTLTSTAEGPYSFEEALKQALKTLAR